jgi:hypothetical protein
MATRGRRKVDATSKLSLVQALAFAEGILKTDRDFREKHVYIGRGMLVGFDGTLAVGHPITEDIEAVPHSGKLLKALERADESVSVTLNDATRISVKSGKFRAVIDCLQIGEFYSPQPDAPICDITDALKTGFETITHIISDAAEKVHLASVLVEYGSMSTTDSRIGLQYWHGLNLPYMVLPKAAAVAITKTKKPLVKFGFSGRSATFFFEGGAWIRTQLFEDKWPDIGAILDAPSSAGPVPPSLWAGVRAVAPFCDPRDDNRGVYFHDSAVSSHGSQAQGAVYEVDGLTHGSCFNSELLLKIEPIVKTIDFTTDRNAAYFFGDNVRGKIMGIRWDQPRIPTPAEIAQNRADRMEDDFPF